MPNVPRVLAISRSPATPREVRARETVTGRDRAEFSQSARSDILAGHDRKASMAFWSTGMAQNSVILSPSV